MYLKNVSRAEDFGKNFLLIKGVDENKSSYFEKPTDDSGWSGMPVQMIGTTWLGVRDVYIQDDCHYFVKITEFYPVAGRIWTTFYNIDTWSGWKSHTPS